MKKNIEIYDTERLRNRMIWEWKRPFPWNEGERCSLIKQLRSAGVALCDLYLSSNASGIKVAMRRLYREACNGLIAESF